MHLSQPDLAYLYARWDWRSLVTVMQPRKQAKRWLQALVVGVSALLVGNPTLAAERIYISYGVLERSVPIKALAAYARTGVISDDLATYTDYANPQQLEQFRGALLSRIPLSPVAISQFLYTPIGENLLARLGRVIQSDSRQSGFYAIRSALILAAADREGLTLLNVLQKFPSRGIRIDVERALEVVGTIQQSITQTERAVTAVNQQARAEAVSAPVVLEDPSTDLRNPGPLAWRKQTITLTDPSRSRTYPADIYLPQPKPLLLSRLRPPYPVVVVSHGLGSDRTTLAFLAEQLASYGFVAVVVEHLGSNAQQLKALISGTADEVAKPREFIDRPLDVKFVLDELTRQSSRSGPLQGFLDLQKVGVVGQSFGGYTTLALVSPTANFQALRQQCPPGQDSLNLSLLLQCLVVQLPPKSEDLYDPRVKAAIAINPVTSSVLGQPSLSQIKVPVMIVAGSADTVTPALPEQIRPFTWLTVAQKYLVMMNGGTHFSAIGGGGPNDPLAVPDTVVGPNPVLARRYINALSVAFFGNYLDNRTNYRPLLTAGYVRRISQAPLTVNLIQAFTSPQLNQALEGNTPIPTPLDPGLVQFQQR